MKKLFRMTFIIFLLLHSLSFAIEQTAENKKNNVPDEQQTLSNIDEIARKVANLFPKVEGKILSLNGNMVSINIGSKNGISQGIRLGIFREGKEFFHPVSKQLMGRFETPIGIIEVKEVNEDSASCLILEKKDEPKIGDKVRITSGKIVIALILSDKIEKNTAANIYDAFEDTGRFRIVEDEKIMTVLKKEGIKSLGLDKEEEIKRVGKDLNAEGIVFLDIKTTAKGPYLKAEFVHAFDGKHLGSYDAIITLSEKKEIELPLPERKDYWKSFDFDYKARLMGIGDLDGDGKNEIVISDGTKIRIYRFESSNLFEIWADKGNAADNHIAIDVADINGDGKAEIFVTNYGDNLRSFVIEFREGGYERIWNNVPLFFRIIGIPGGGRSLIAKDPNGNINEYTYSEGKYIKGKPLRLPPDIDIYGFAFVDWDKTGSAMVLAIDENDYLNLYNKDGEKIWRSKERYGGYSLFYERAGSLPFEKTERVMARGRIIIRDYGDEGRQKAIVFRNVPLTYLFREFRGYSTSDVMWLTWNGFDMAEEWRIGKIDGFVADYAIGDITNTGKEILCLLMNPTIRIIGGKSVRMPGLGDVISGKSYLLLYNFPRR